MRANLAGYGSAAGAILLWSTMATAFKLSLGRATTHQLLAVSVSISFLFFVAASVSGPHRHPSVVFTLPNVLRSAAMGLLNPWAYYSLLFAAYDRLPGYQAQILNYTWPLFLAILAGPILGKPPAFRTFIGIVLSLAGVVLVYVNRIGGEAADLGGVLFALASAAVWATFWLFNAKDDRPTMEKLSLGFAFGTIYGLIALLLAPDPTLPSVDALPLLAYVGLAEMGLSFFLWLRALERSWNPAALGTIAYATPFLSIVFLRFFLGEEVSILAAAGLVLVVGGIGVGKTGTAS